MKQKILQFLIIAFALTTVSTAFAEGGDAEFLKTTGKKAKIVGKGALFGLGGGLVIGLASQVVRHNTRTIFLFGSLGMYAGIGMGLYVILAPKGATPYEGPDTYEDFSQYHPFSKQFDPMLVKANQIQVPVYSFTF